MERLHVEIDYDRLMDLRVDFAFKLLFTKGDPRLLISLLNAIFANKRISRTVKSVLIKNPYFDKESSEDKLSILDIRATLEDGTNILIEMHMHGMGELKAKTIRSWARAYGEELETGEKYDMQAPTVAITFANGQVQSIETPKEARGDKIHRLCMIMDCEDLTVFTDAMELHYIDMKAFAKAVNEVGSIEISDTNEIMFAKWLSVITQKEIADKGILAEAHKDEEEIWMAVSTLARQGEDKYARQAYLRRQDEIWFFNKAMYEKAQAERKIEEANRETEQERRRAELAETEIEKLRQQLAELQALSQQ